MADAIGERKLSIREKLKAALQGDAKPGSLREHLAEGITGISEFSPLGVVYAADDTDRNLNQGKYGQAALSAVGMIPGAGGGAKKAAQEIVEHLSKNAPEKLAELLAIGEKSVKGSRSLGTVARKPIEDDATFLARSLHADQLNKIATELRGQKATAALDQSRLPKLDRIGESARTRDVDDAEHAARLRLTGTSPGKESEYRAAEENLRQSRIKPGKPPSSGIVGAPSVRESMQEAQERQMNPELFSPEEEAAHLERGRKADLDPDERDYALAHPGSMVKRPPLEPGRARQIDDHMAEVEERAMSEKGLPPGALSHNSQEAQYGISDDEMQHIKELVGDDEAKGAFIANAMSDEGGNVPYDVAGTYLDTLKMKNPAEYEALVKDIGSGDHMQAAEELGDAYSIPELLSMHYDLDPETLSKAYSSKPMSRPTQ